MKKLILFALCIAALTLTACQIPDLSGIPVIGETLAGLLGTDTPDPTPDDPNPDTPAYNDPTHQTGEFRVIFKTGDGAAVIHRYDKGEMPDPPAVNDYESGPYIMKFSGWTTPLVPVTENTSYQAKYEKELKPYTVTFIYGANGQRKTTSVQNCGVKPTVPTVSDDGDYKFVCWDREIVASSADTTYTAVYTKMIDKDMMQRVYEASLFDYQIHNWGDMMQACPIYVLALHEHEDPKSGAIRDRLIAQIDALCGAGSAPDFDAWCNWSFPIITAAIALVRDTPSVWDVLSYTQKEKLDTMMLAFSYLCSVATSDYNEYHTGPGLRGNYYKTWNPNYRLANIPNIVFTTYYFGGGDMKRGADFVNERIRNFNEATYQSMLTKYQTYGWDDAYACWTTPEKQEGSGDAHKLLVLGGVVMHNTNDQTGLQSSGTGSRGVNNGGLDYRYTGYLGIPFTLYEGEKIIEDLMYHNYSGGTVKNEHWADGNGDGLPEKVAGVADGTVTPFMDQAGMMLELASGVRSSTSYCSDDFTMIVCILSATSVLRKYENIGGQLIPKTDIFGNPEVLYDYTKNPELWQMIQVGNEDFLYKFVHGYNSYAHGSYGVSSSLNSEAKNAGGQYYPIKNIWRAVMKPRGDVPTFETLENAN